MKYLLLSLMSFAAALGYGYSSVRCALASPSFTAGLFFSLIVNTNVTLVLVMSGLDLLGRHLQNGLRGILLRVLTKTTQVAGNMYARMGRFYVYVRVFALLGVAVMFLVPYHASLKEDGFCIWTIGYVLAASCCVVIAIIFAGDALHMPALREWGWKVFLALDFKIPSRTLALLRFCVKSFGRLVEFVVKKLSFVNKAIRAALLTIQSLCFNFWTKVFLPVRQMLWVGLKTVWKNPGLPFVASLLALYSIYQVQCGWHLCVRLCVCVCVYVCLCVCVCVCVCLFVFLFVCVVCVCVCMYVYILISLHLGNISLGVHLRIFLSKSLISLNSQLHSGAWKISAVIPPILVPLTIVQNTWGWLLSVVMSLWASTAPIEQPLSILLRGLSLVGAEVWHVWEVLIDVSTPSWYLFRSTSFSWMFYLVCTACAKLELYRFLKMKFILAPCMILSAASNFAPDWFNLIFAVSFCWIMLGIGFRIVEERQRLIAQQRFGEFRRTELGRPTSRAVSGAAVGFVTVLLLLLIVHVCLSKKTRFLFLFSSTNYSSAHAIKHSLTRCYCYCFPFSSFSTQQLPPSATPDKVYEDVICGICHAEYTEVAGRYTLACGHQFHKPCIAAWIPINPRCPMCQESVYKSARIIQAVF